MFSQKLRMVIAEVKARYPLLDVLREAGVNFKKNGAIWLVANCPFPNHADESPSFKVNTQHPNKYHCFGCGVDGDVLDFIGDFYGYTNIEEKVYHLTGKRIDEFYNEMGGLRCRVRDPGEEGKYLPRPAEYCAKVYEFLLKKLTLSNAHLSHLVGRGLSIEKVMELGYKTFPVSRDERIALCKSIRDEGLDMWRVPGFFKLPREAQELKSKWCIGGDFIGNRTITIRNHTEEIEGLIIPTRDEAGRVIRLKLRNREQPGDLSEKEKREWPQKYLALSTMGRIGGATGSPMIHWSGPVKGGRFPDELFLTEGELKSDVGSFFLNCRFAGLQGVSQDSSPAIKQAKEAGIERLNIAMDSERKTHVQVAIVRAARQARELELEVRVVLWDDNCGKGFDDLLKKNGTWKMVPFQFWFERYITLIERKEIERLMNSSDARRKLDKGNTMKDSEIRGQVHTFGTKAANP